MTVSGTVTSDPQAIPPEEDPSLHKHVTITLTGDMDPGTFYLARIKGGASGVTY